MESNEKLTPSERIINAITIGGVMLVGGIALILLSPVFFIKNLLTSKKVSWDEIKKKLDELGKKIDDATDPDSGEDWKKKHNDEYGS